MSRWSGLRRFCCVAARGAGRALAVAATLCTGCGDLPAPSDPMPRFIGWIEAGRLQLSSFSSDRVRVIVRHATRPEVERSGFEAEQKTTGGLGAFGAAAVPLGVIAGPMFGGAMILGGAFVGVTAGTIAATGQSQQRQVEEALRHVDFVGMVARRVEAALVPAMEQARDPVLELAIVRYGIAETARQGELCVVAEFEVLLRDAGERYRDRIVVLPYLRSRDAPVPVCVSRDLMAEEGGRRLREGLSDYASALPALLSARIPGLPWRH